MILVDPSTAPPPSSGQAALVERLRQLGRDPFTNRTVVDAIDTMKATLLEAADALSTASPAPACASCAELKRQADEKDAFYESALLNTIKRAETAEESLQAQAREIERLTGLLESAREGLALVEHKFERAGGIWKVAERGVPLGAMSWASNIENGINAIAAALKGQ